MHSNWIAHQTTRNSYINNSMESKDARELLSPFQTYSRPSTTDRLLSHKALSLYIIIARASLSLSLCLSLDKEKWSTTKKDFIVRVVIVRGFNASSKREEREKTHTQGLYLGFQKGLSLSLSLSLFFPSFLFFFSFFFFFFFFFFFPIFFFGGKNVPSRISLQN